MRTKEAALANELRKDCRRNLTELGRITAVPLTGSFNFYAEFLFRDMDEFGEAMDEIKDSGLVRDFSEHFLTDVKQEDVCLPIGER